MPLPVVTVLKSVVGMIPCLIILLLAPRMAFAVSIPQTPDSIWVDYAIQDSNLILMLATRPPISGCGTIKNLPIGGGFDTEAIDLYVGPYDFTPAPSGTRGAACGPTYKISIGRVSVPFTDIIEKKITRIRLWSGTQLDTFLIGTNEAGISLSQINGAGFFRLGTQKPKVPDAFNRLGQ